jgi:membrane fusion protein, multidrug efflux system
MRSIVWLSLLAIAACTSQAPTPPAQKTAPRFPVQVQPVTTQQVQYSLTSVGSVEAFEKIQVTAHVAGKVERVLFTEGDTVGRNQVLVEIDMQRYQLAQKAAAATLERAEAALAEASSGLERRQKAVAENPGIIPGEEIQGWSTRVRTLNAEVLQSKIAKQQADLDARDAAVRAPAPGMIQTRTVQTGQYVQPGTVLATLLRRDPLLLRFQIPADDADRLKRGMPVTFTVSNSSTNYSAVIRHVADAADASSRQVQVTAEINAKGSEDLRSGAFAQVVVPIDIASPSPVIPQTAIRPTERGFVVFVVEQGVAKERRVTLGMRTNAGLVEIREGLQAGENLVVRGNEPLEDGALVTMENTP